LLLLRGVSFILLYPVAADLLWTSSVMASLTVMYVVKKIATRGVVLFAGRV
jgi:hypothetical protein